MHVYMSAGNCNKKAPVGFLVLNQETYITLLYMYITIQEKLGAILATPES